MNHMSPPAGQTFRLRLSLRGWLRRGPLSAWLLAGLAGCATAPSYTETIGNNTQQVDAVMRQVDARATVTLLDDPLLAPRSIEESRLKGSEQYWDMSLEEVVQTAMTNSQVLRDLGATILRSPETVGTSYERALVQTDPRFGMEAALSAFDAQFDSALRFQGNHRTFNNFLFGGGTTDFEQDRHDYLLQLSKTTATGSQLALRSITDYDANNATGNIFGSAWQQQIEGEIRQPLLQGAGLTFNRIAGPGAIPGLSNGVLIAKVNNDMDAAEFERRIRDYVSDVMNAYWDLYFSYRDLDSKQQAFTRGMETWRAYEAQKASGRESGLPEALSREQFYRFQSDLQDAIAGRAGQRTQDYNGASGGVFRSVNGVHLAERRLRLLIGIPITDVRIIRPTEEPISAPIQFDWSTIVGEALHRRSELHKQRLLVNRNELELIAARNYLNPRLDVVGKYRVRGLGKDLAGGGSQQLNSAFSELGSFDFQEWEAGLEYSVPIGFRRAHSAVQHAEFQVAHSRAILKEQERQVVHDLGVMVSELDRAWQQIQTNLNRYLAAQDAIDQLEQNRQQGLQINLEQLLDAQRRYTDAQTRYYQARVDYALALKNIHYEKGSLLDFCQVVIQQPPAVGAGDGQPQPAPLGVDAGVSALEETLPGLLQAAEAAELPPDGRKLAQ